MNDDIATLRRAIAALAPKPQLRRYTPEMRAKIVALAAAHPELTPWQLATELGMTPPVLYRMLSPASPAKETSKPKAKARTMTAATFKPVRIVEQKQRLALRAIVIDGIDIDGVAQLLRTFT